MQSCEMEFHPAPACDCSRVSIAVRSHPALQVALCSEAEGFGVAISGAFPADAAVATRSFQNGSGTDLGAKPR